MSAAPVLIYDGGGDDVRGYLPQFCRSRIILAQFKQISCIRAHKTLAE